MKKILVIEDNTDIRENLEELLELSGYEVRVAENGKVGVQKVKEAKPDLILCDVMMPELDGFGVLRILDRNPTTADIPFIFLTAKAEKTDIRKGMNLGADDYITKPFDDVELLDAIEMRLKKSERLKAVAGNSPENLSSFINEAKGMEALENLSENRENRLYKKKDIIFQEGDLPRRLYFIADGKVKIYKTNDDGKELIVQVLDAGNFVGYNALLQQEEYATSAAAMENTNISLIPKDDFLLLLYGNRDFSAQFVKMLANNVFEKEEKLLSLAYNSIRKRVAEALLELYQRQQAEQISILRDDLAGMVGTAKESVIRTLTDFKNEGYIDIKNGMITILKAGALLKLPS